MNATIAIVEIVITKANTRKLELPVAPASPIKQLAWERPGEFYETIRDFKQDDANVTLGKRVKTAKGDIVRYEYEQRESHLTNTQPEEK